MANKRSRKQTTVAQTALVPVTDPVFNSILDTPISVRFALVPVSSAFTRVESVHGGVIIDADPDPLASRAIDTFESGDLVDADKLAESVAQSTVGYVRNAVRAQYARFLVKLSARVLAAYNAGNTRYTDGSPVLYRVADVATQIVAQYRKTGDLPGDIDSPRMRAMLADVVNPAHHAKCLIAAGLFNSSDLPSAILWDAARKLPFYALPNTSDMPFLSLIYGDETGHGGAFNHQLASDFLSRLAPSYVTPILYNYVRDLNTTSKMALHKFLREYLDRSRVVRSTGPLTRATDASHVFSVAQCLDYACDAADLVLVQTKQNSQMAVGHISRYH